MDFYSCSCWSIMRKGKGSCLQVQTPWQRMFNRLYLSPDKVGTNAACNYGSNLGSVHQVPITARWTEAVWNTKFAWHFYTWPALGIEPQTFWSSPTPYPLGHMHGYLLRRPKRGLTNSCLILPIMHSYYFNSPPPPALTCICSCTWAVFLNTANLVYLIHEPVKKIKSWKCEFIT